MTAQAPLWTPEDSESLGQAWGLDPGTTALALGIHDGLHYVTMSAGLPRHRDPSRRLAAALPVAQEFLERAAHRYGPPSLVVIEQPAGTGHRVHPSTWFATGVAIQAAAWAIEAPIHWVLPPVWKKEALGDGHGHAKKPEIVEWAKTQGWKGASQDEADTCAMARCAYVRLAAHLRANPVS